MKHQSLCPRYEGEFGRFFCIACKLIKEPGVPRWGKDVLAVLGEYATLQSNIMIYPLDTCTTTNKRGGDATQRGLNDRVEKGLVKGDRGVTLLIFLIDPLSGGL